MAEPATVTRWSRGFVAASACWLVVWQAATLAGVQRRTTVTLGLFGFVLHVVFGKAYSLVPSYFDRELAVAHAPAVHLPLALVGTTGLAMAPLAATPPAVGRAGALLWAGGVGLFLGTLLWTIRDNLTGSDTATGDHNADREPVDRAANATMLVALEYLAVGTYGILARRAPLPVLFDGYPPRTSHLLAAGMAVLLVFAVGFRLLPRFLGATPSRWLVSLVLSTGTVAPLLLASGLPAGPLLQIGAVAEASAVTGFAVASLRMVRASDRRRIGLVGVVAGVVAGLGVVALGLTFAFGGPRGLAVQAHYRLALVGFLGVTIVGVTFQFYPPDIGRFPAAGSRSAAGVLVLMNGGLVAEVTGLLATRSVVVTIGRSVEFVGAVWYAYLLLGLFVQRTTGGPRP